jgi:dihydrofolate reductase
MALPMDDSFDAYNAERLRAADTLLLGRKSYQMFSGFWPAVADDPKASANNHEVSRLNNAIEKIVVSNSFTPDEANPWRATTRTLRGPEAHAQIAELKRRSGRDILVFGSRSLWNDLLAAGLVDELHFMVGAVVLGDGTPAFGPKVAPRLRLLDSRTSAGSSNVLIRYAVGG